MSNMNFYLLPHQDNRFKKILVEIPTIQKRISIDKWNRLLGELFSIDTALSDSWGLFRHIKEALHHVEG